MPPLTGAAVKVTGLPSQTGLVDGDTVMLTGSIGLTNVIMVLEVVGLFSAQEIVEVSSQFTWSPSCGA